MYENSFDKVELNCEQKNFDESRHLKKENIELILGDELTLCMFGLLKENQAIFNFIQTNLIFSIKFFLWVYTEWWWKCDGIYAVYGILSTILTFFAITPSYSLSFSLGSSSSSFFIFCVCELLLTVDIIFLMKWTNIHASFLYILLMVLMIIYNDDECWTKISRKIDYVLNNEESRRVRIRDMWRIAYCQLFLLSSWAVELEDVVIFNIFPTLTACEL